MGKELKRMNYFDGLFLEAEEYRHDKDYIRRIQGLHNRYLHTWGIVCGLEVKSVIDSSMEVVVTEGVALDLSDEGNYGLDVKESTSRQILIYEGHPDNPLDLSEYNAEENIYIFVSYCEIGADRDNEKGQGQEIHIWERGQIKHSNTKPEDCKKDIILARVVPRIVTRVIKNSDGSSTTYEEAVIDNTCIFENDIDGTPLRVYAGPYAKVLELERFNFKLGEEAKDMPHIKTDEVSKNLRINSDSVKFSGKVTVRDLEFEGQLIYKNKDGEIKEEFKAKENFLQLNSPDEDITGSNVPLKIRDGGLEVYRGGNNTFPDARIIWSEGDKVWKAGLGTDLSPVFYGSRCDNLKDQEKRYFVDNLHMHGKLFSSKGTIISVNNKGDISSALDWRLPPTGISSSWGALGFENSFADLLNIEEPILTGLSGGLLGTAEDGQKAVLSWGKNGCVGVGTVNPTDTLEVCGSARILSNRNPLRLTSQWTGFPDLTTNQAEICNDTTIHQALMIVGNQSAGQGRKVAIWDRLDINGILRVNGKMQISKGLKPSAGTGNNGIIFPIDPGGGSGDSARIKYYPRTGEACTLEIGTSNDGDDNISFLPSGSTGIGTNDPKDKFDVSGSTRILSGSNPIRFTSVWSGFPDISSRNAEISNDINKYKTLMIVGNRSAGQGRKVSIWDRLDVNGTLAALGDLQINGAIVPGVGNCDVKGIMFPRDPYRGSGDAAWIRYYSDTLRGGGHNMTLEIGISNDSNVETYTRSYFVPKCPWNIPNGCGYWKTETVTFKGNKGDRLRFHASGGTYIDGNFYYTSTRECKENIRKLKKEEVRNAIEGIEPVEFNFKGDSTRISMGFIAEEIPEILAASDRRAVSPIEILTVLVSEVRDQERLINKLKKKVAALQA